MEVACPKNLQPMTVNLLSVLKKEGIIRIKRNVDRGPMSHLDKVLEDFKNLSKTKQVKMYEINVEPYEILVLSNNQKITNSFIV